MSNAHEVRDLALAPLGREAITRAEAEMPGLMALRRRYARERPLAGARIAGSLHMTVETAVLIETLAALGAELRWSSCNIFSTHDAAAAAVAAAGIPVFAWKGQTLEDYWRCIDLALDFGGRGPDLLVDDGGDATWYLHRGASADEARGGASADERAGLERIALRRRATPRFFAEALAGLRGISEETTTGALRLRALAARGELAAPAYDVNFAVTKSKFDNVYGSRESLLDAIRRATDRMIAGKRAVVCGYGDVGKGSAEALAAARARVFVTEVDPICALQALMDGHEVVRLEDVVEQADIIVTATGDRDVVTLEHLRRAKEGALVCNIGHFDCEIQVAALDAAPDVRRERLAPGLDRYTFEGGRSFYLLAEGRLVNLACANGHPAFVMSCSFANQVLAQLDLWRARRPIGVHRLPKALDEEVARLHVEALGGRLTSLTRAQAEYLGVPAEGPFKADEYRY